MRTALHTWLVLDTHVSNLVPSVFGLSGQQGWHCCTDQKASRLWVQDWHMSISFPDGLCCFVQGKGQWGHWPKGWRPLGTILRKCLQLVLLILWTILPCSVCRQIYSLEQCPRGKSRVILEVKEVKQSTKKKKKLKTNSHKRKNRAKKMMLNFRIWNFAVSRWNGWMITSDYGTKISRYFVPFFLFFLGHRKTLYWIGEKQWNKIFSVPFCCLLIVPLQGPQMDKLSPDAIKLAQTLYN